MRIWAKIMLNQKIKKDTMLEVAGDYDPDKFQAYLEAIAYKLHIGTPIILTKHLNHFLEFNITSFGQSDFAEVIDFDQLVIESASK
ncbi:MAG: hypothetical protein LBN07_04245 [Christensenellaceae bacterium]|jgi:hypothetical protein|nr:hypothetical protein [Christensenellaceae bacterium]